MLKMGRTQLQDAVPMTLGQEFGTYAVMIAEDQLRLAEACQLICEMNIGGTAIGTGLNAHPEYAAHRLRISRRHHRHCRSCAPRTWSRRPRTRARSCSSPVCSSGSR